MEQKHLSYEAMTDLGCFYTPRNLVDLLIKSIKNNINDYSDCVYVDSSCGYGSFLAHLSEYKTIGYDIDGTAIEIARKIDNKSEYIVKNTLSGFSRNNIPLDGKKLVIIGNPPYNDTTSIVKQGIKKAEPCLIDEDLKTRDLGISFLLSYNKLQADYVAVLHPLSYMIKKTNYNLLKNFYNNYRLIDHYIISSQIFSKTSKTTGFPIIVALYKKSEQGTSYSDVTNATYKTETGKNFKINYESISNYISKYPTKKVKHKAGDILFYTMRDINALKRSKTFINEWTDNAIIVDKSKLSYYCYVDAFKDYISHIPYYLGNIDVFIDNKEFKSIENVFVTKSIQKHEWLKELYPNINLDDNFVKIENYLKKIIGDNYVY